MKTLLLIAACLSLFVSGCQDGRRQIAWGLYHGEIDDYTVDISEAEYTDGEWMRMIYLYSKDKEWSIITAHSDTSLYNGPQDWHRLFYCGYPEETNGCNAVRLGEPRVWEPCPFDERKVAPFTGQQVDEWLDLVTKAMDVVYNQNHRITPTDDYWWITQNMGLYLTPRQFLWPSE